MLNQICTRKYVYEHNVKTVVFSNTKGCRFSGHRKIQVLLCTRNCWPNIDPVILIHCWVYSCNECISYPHHVDKEWQDHNATQDLYSLSGKTSYRQISWSLEAARLNVAMAVSLWNLAAAEVPAKFQSDWKSLNPNLAASRLHEILR